MDAQSGKTPAKTRGRSPRPRARPKPKPKPLKVARNKKKETKGKQKKKGPASQSKSTKSTEILLKDQKATGSNNTTGNSEVKTGLKEVRVKVEPSSAYIKRANRNVSTVKVESPVNILETKTESSGGDVENVIATVDCISEHGDSELEWNEIEKLWNEDSDPLDPLTVPFVDAKYKRVNKDVSNFFSQADPRNQSRKVVLIQLPQDLSDEGSNESGDVKIKREHGGSVELLEKKFMGLKPGESGKIGKVQIHKSGKTRLVLGESEFNLDPGLNCAFQQDLVHINEKDNEFVNLSSIDGRMICTPRLNFLIEKLETKNAKESPPSSA